MIYIINIDDGRDVPVRTWVAEHDANKIKRRLTFKYGVPDCTKTETRTRYVWIARTYRIDLFEEDDSKAQRILCEILGEA